MLTLPEILSSTPHIGHSAAVALLPLSLCFLVLAFHYLRHKSSGINQRELPSPPGDPILGHLRFVPLKATWLTFADWYKNYGEIILVKMFNKPMVILNSAEAAQELLEKKGANFSGWPPLRFFRVWVGWKDALPVMQYNDDNYHKQKRIMRPYLSLQGVVNHRPTLYEYAQVLLDNLRDSPDDFVEHMQSYVSCVMVMILYGYRPSSNRDPRILMVEAVGRSTTDVEMTTVAILDLLPFLSHLPAWLPGMGAKRHAKKGNELRQQLEESFLNYVLECKAAGIQNNSMMSQVLDDLEKETDNVASAGKDRQLGMNVMQMGAILYAVGVDTTASSLTAFFLAMVLHPYVAHRAQQEIDNVTGGPGVRLPSIDDRKHMPYVECVIKEVLRWNPPAPLGVVHRSERKDEYLGMQIPANSLIIPNIWFMCHDETHFPSPSEFNPDRYYSRNTSEDVRKKPNVKMHDPKNIVFGFGRRICPGEHIADAMLWTAITFILSTFNILPPLDPDSGDPITPTVGFTAGSTSHPEHFACRIVPRKYK